MVNWNWLQLKIFRSFHVVFMNTKVCATVQLCSVKSTLGAVGPAMASTDPYGPATAPNGPLRPLTAPDGPRRPQSLFFNFFKFNRKIEYFGLIFDQKIKF